VIDSLSPNHEPRPADTPVDMLVFHYTGMADAATALARLRDPEAKVSAHYLVDEDGTVHRLVPEDRRAWHAGEAAWRGHGDVNARSIGIELVNPGHDLGYRPFPEAQMRAAIALARAVIQRHPVPPRNVVGHADVAPERKKDPGELFDWRRLAGEGVGLWAEPVTADGGPAGDVLPDLLHRFGYPVSDDDPIPAVTAFQRHFRPERVDGMPDAECAARAAALLDR